jgi:hypothetical protein
LNVDREQLIEAITEKRNEVAAIHQEAVDKAQEVLDAAQPSGSVSEWLRAIADQVDANEFDVRSLTADVAAAAPHRLVRRGAQRGGRGRGRGVPQIPDFPDSNLKDPGLRDGSRQGAGEVGRGDCRTTSLKILA